MGFNELKLILDQEVFRMCTDGLAGCQFCFVYIQNNIAEVFIMERLLRST